MSPHSLLLFLHLLAASVALGMGFVFPVLLVRLRGQNPERSLFGLQVLRLLDSVFVGPAYVLSLLSGIGLLFVADVPAGALWVWGSLALFALGLALAVGVFAPLLKKQAAEVEQQGPDTDAYRWLAGKTLLLSWVLSCIGFAILLLMVFKPQLAFD